MNTSSLVIDPTIFRAYDIRGIVGSMITPEVMRVIGQALGTLMCEQGEEQLMIARDGRESSPVLAEALCAGILSTGCHVLDVGMVPTPVLYFATQRVSSRSGVMLTGSHNPAEYNGLKMMIKGRTLAESDIQQLYQRIQSQQFSAGEGRYRRYAVEDIYVEAICHDVHLSRPLKIVIDAGNGIAGKIAPNLFRALGCEVIELFCEVDGRFPHHHPDPSQPENLADLISAVHTHQADVGLAFDGDADRLGVVTNRGNIIWPDRLLMLYAKYLLRDEPGATIIYDVKCTQHLGDLILQAGGVPLMWKTGHSLIKAKIAETKAKLAGEMSGHFFFNDRWYGFDDALYAGARLLEILSGGEEDCDTIFSALPDSVNTEELKIQVNEKEKYSLMDELIAAAQFNREHDLNMIDGLRVNFADGWGLVRPSNTTPCLVLRFEAVNEGMLSEIQQLFRAWILSVKPDLVLPF